MTPANEGYMIAGYCAAAVIYLGYTIVLLRRRRAIALRWRGAPEPATRPVTPPPPDAAA